MKLRKLLFFTLMALVFLFVAACGNNDEKADGGDDKTGKEETEVTDLILATTTSTQDTGLLEELLVPMFEEKYPYNVQIIAVGTGQALEMGKRGEADVLLTHAPEAEKELVDNGDVINYKRVMYNDFIIVGPADDPAGIKGKSVEEAFKTIHEKQATFVSRGDDSGTHKKELSIWESAGINPEENKNYIETGQGMGNTLRVASEKNAYVLTDRGTYLAQKENYPDMEIMVEGDEQLLNIYHVMQVNPEKSDKINEKGAKAWVEFMIDDEVQDAIEEFGKDKYGQSLFFKYAE